MRRNGRCWLPTLAVVVMLSGCANGVGETASATHSANATAPTPGAADPPTPTVTDTGMVVSTAAPIPTPTPPGPTVDIPPYPDGGVFFAGVPIRYDRHESDVKDMTVLDTDGEVFAITTGERTLHLDDGRALDVPAETPVHGQCASLLTASERDFIAGLENATVTDADRYGAAFPCGVYGMIAGTTVKWLVYTDLASSGIGPGVEGLIPLREYAVGVDPDRLQLASDRSVPRAEHVALHCHGDYDSIDAVLEDFGDLNEVYAEPGSDQAVALACLYRD